MRSFTGHLHTTWGPQTVFHKCPPLLSDAFTSQRKKKVKMEKKGLREVCVPQHMSRCTSKSGLNKTRNFYYLQAVACHMECCAPTPSSKVPAPRRCSTSPGRSLSSSKSKMATHTSTSILGKGEDWGGWGLGVLVTVG